jgi:hypothetical protein
MDLIFDGDEDSLIFKEVKAGGSEADERNIILNYIFSTSILVGRIREIDKSINKKTFNQIFEPVFG